MLRIIRQRLHPVAQLRRMDTQVLRGLHIRHAAFLDQPHSLKLELARKLPSLHDPPPAPSKHLTRCPRNRVQAIRRKKPEYWYAGFARSYLRDEIETGKKNAIKEVMGKLDSF